jgi:hypothetical protein
MRTTRDDVAAAADDDDERMHELSKRGGMQRLRARARKNSH